MYNYFQSQSTLLWTVQGMQYILYTVLMTVCCMLMPNDCGELFPDNILIFYRYVNAVQDWRLLMGEIEQLVRIPSQVRIYLFNLFLLQSILNVFSPV